MYKHLSGAGDAGDRNSTLHRQARLDSLPPPRSVADVQARLSDTHDATWPIFRPMTLASLILDGASGALRVWCCHSAPASGEPPAYSWQLLDFFKKDS